MLRMLFLLLIVEYVRAAFLMSYLPAYGVSHLGFSVAMVGTAVTAHYAADTVLKIFVGYLLDRYQARWILPLGLAIGLVALLSLRWFPSGWWLVIATTLYGIGLAPVWLICVSYLQVEHRGTQMGAIYTAWLAGMGAGLFFTNFLLDRSALFAYWLLIGLSALGLLFSFSLLRQEQHKLGSAPFAEQWRELVERLKSIGPLLPGMVLQTLGAGLLVPILPTFATHRLGLSYSQYSLLLLVGGICAVLGLVPMGRLSDHLGQKWFLVGGFGIFAISLICLSNAHTFLSGCIWAVVLGISYSAVLPAWNAILASQVAAQQQSVSWGIFSSVEGIGVMLGPIIGGWIGEHISSRAPLMMSAIVMGAIAVFYALYPLHTLLRKTNPIS